MVSYSSGSSGASHAFHCIKFASTLGHSRSASGADVGTKSEREQREQFSEEEGDELLVVTASLQVFHFANVPLAALEV